MSLIVGRKYVLPNHTQNDLQLYYDVAESSSYTSGSSTINDISGNGFTGSFINSIEYSSDNGGYLITNNIDSYLKLQSYDFSASPMTVIVGMKDISAIGGLDEYGAMLCAEQGATWIGNWNLTEQWVVVGQYISEAYGGARQSNWTIHTGTSTAGGPNAYYAELVNKTVNPNQGGNYSYHFGVSGESILVGASGAGKGEPPTQFRSVGFSFLQVYSRILTYEEIEQVYWYFRPRFL